MPLVYCDNSIVDYDQPAGIVVPVQPETVVSQARRQVIGGLRPVAQREQPSRYRNVNGELLAVHGPVALGSRPRSGTAGSPPPPKEDRNGDDGPRKSDGELPVLPTPPSTASTEFRQTLNLSGYPQLTARRPGALGTTPRAMVLAGSNSAREMRTRPRKPKLIQLNKARSARGPNPAAVSDREEDGRGQRRIQGARVAAREDSADMFVRSEYTGVQRNLMEWAVEPQGFSREMQALQQMQTDFDLERMRTAELMAHITTRHNSMKEFELMRGGNGFWDQEGRWKPMPFIECIRRYAWKDAAQLLKWSQVGAKRRLEFEQFKQTAEYLHKSAREKKKQEQQSYERPDYAVDTDQNMNTALHHCLAPFQAGLSFKRDSKQRNSWHPKGSQGAVGTRNRPPPEFLTALIQANPAAIGARNRNGLTPLHFALGCTTTEINASVETILEMCNACPEAVRVKNNTAELPLHVATAKNAPEPVLRKLIQMYPDACLQANCWGSLPIHVGLVNGMPESQIRILIEACPSTVGEVDEDGKTPCAIALTIGAPDSTVMFLVQMYPDCLSVRDASGLCPLSLALVNQAPEAIILKLIDYYPRAVLMQASHTLEVPLHIAIRHAKRHSRRLDRAGSSRGSSRGGSSRERRRRHDEGHVPSGMRRTGQCWPIQYSGTGDGFHVPPSRGGLLPIQQVGGGPNKGQHSRNSLVTPSMNFTPMSLHTEEAGFSASTGTSATASGRTPEITVSAGVGFAPGSLELPSAFGRLSVATHLMGFRPPRSHIKEVAAKLTDNSKTVLARPFSSGVEGYLERIVVALLAADEVAQKISSPESRKESWIAKVRTIEAVDLHDRTPLHTACVRQVPNSVIKILVDANPKAVEEKDQDGWVPLHRYVNGLAYAAAEDSLLSVLTLLEACPELGAARHATVSIDHVTKQAAQQDKLKHTQIRDEMMAAGLFGAHQPAPPKTQKKGVVVSAGRREAMREASNKRRAKAGRGPSPKNPPAKSLSAAVQTNDQQKQQAGGFKGSVKLNDAADDVADARKSRKEEEARLGRALTKVESLNRLDYMKKEQMEQRIAHEAKIVQMKANKHKGEQPELFPYELAEQHRLKCVGSVSLKAAQMSEHVRTTSFDDCVVDIVNCFLSAVCAQLTR
eukprot:COSAG02_NODE_300_length_25279_cov_159.676529_2_plen_1139_part_00